MDRPRRFGIFGGTFDPIHIGHLVLAEVARAALELDRVLFIPTYQSVFKHDQRLSPPEIRRRMCEAACAGNEAFEVDDREIVRGGESYTVDTLRELSAEYPDAEFVLIVGSDVLEKLDQWKEASAIAALAEVAAFQRPGEEPNPETLARLAAGGFRISQHVGPQLVIHSSALRERVAAGEPIRYLVPDPVLRIIDSERLYRPLTSKSAERSDVALDQDEAKAVKSESDEAAVLSKDFYRARKAELKRRVDAKRYVHSKGVAKTARSLAKTYGVDPDRARLAGILHDWDKCYDNDGMLAHVRELGMESTIDRWSYEHAPGLLHGHTAARELQDRFPALPEEVVMAIERHTTGAPQMSDLDKVLYIADALEPSRNFRNLDELRDLVGEISLDELFFRTYRLWTELLMERGLRLLHPDTVTLWNEYVQAERQRKEALE